MNSSIQAATLVRDQLPGVLEDMMKEWMEKTKQNKTKARPKNQNLISLMSVIRGVIKEFIFSKMA